MRIAVVVNPIGAANERSDLESAVLKAGFSARWYETTEEDPGVGQTRSAIEDGAELVLACGGDGTVRAVAQALANSTTPMGVIPAGTGNLLARNLDIPLATQEAFGVATTGERTVIDIGQVEEEVFTVMAGAGLDAVIMDETSSDAKDRFGSLAYVIEGAKHIFDEPIRAKATVDGELSETGSWATILIGNLGRLQGGVDLFPDSSPDDGLLDIVGLTADGPMGVIAAGVSVAMQNNNSARLFRSSGNVIHLEFAEKTRYELDGEARTPVETLSISVVPRALTVMTPRIQE